MSDDTKGLVAATAGAAVELAGNAGDGGETKRTVRLKDIVLHPLDMSVPIERQVNVYSAMAGGAAARSLPPVRVGFWIERDGGGGAGANGRGGGGPKPTSGAGRNGRPRSGGTDDIRELTEYVPKKYYLLADGDLYRGYLRAGAAKDVECIVIKCNGEADFLARHALVNQRPTAYDPLRLGRIVRYLQTVSRGGASADGTGRTISRTEAEGARRAVDDVMRGCRDTVDQKFIKLHLEEEASNILSGLCEWLGGRLSRFDMPYYIPHAVSKVPPGVQAELAETISLVVRGGTVSDAKFSWPAPEEINMLADTPTFRGEPGAVGGPADGAGAAGGGRGVTVVVPEGDSGGHSHGRAAGRGGSSSVPRATKPTAKAVAAATAAAATTAPPRGGPPVPKDQEMLRNMRDVLVIAGNDRHPPYVVDLRTRRVSVVDEREKVTILREVGDAASRRGAYLMPTRACEWLGLPGTAAAAAAATGGGGAKPANGTGGGETPVRVFTFDSPAGVMQFAKRQEKKQEKDGSRSRGVIIYI